MVNKCPKSDSASLKTTWTSTKKEAEWIFPGTAQGLGKIIPDTEVQEQLVTKPSESAHLLPDRNVTVFSYFAPN